MTSESERLFDMFLLFAPEDRERRDLVRNENPVAAALMSRMNIAPKDRVKVKVECLRLLATLRLDRARSRLISRFVDTYLPLTAADERRAFQSELAQLNPETKEEVMEIMTTWMREGIEQGLQQGLRQALQHEQTLVLRQLKKRFGSPSPETETQVRALTSDQIMDLGIALLDFTSLDDLTDWLNRHAARE